jgi:hypothetical protein
MNKSVGISHIIAIVLLVIAVVFGVANQVNLSNKLNVAYESKSNFTASCMKLMFDKNEIINNCLTNLTMCKDARDSLNQTKKEIMDEWNNRLNCVIVGSGAMGVECNGTIMYACHNKFVTYSQYLDCECPEQEPNCVTKV